MSGKLNSKGLWKTEFHEICRKLNFIEFLELVNLWKNSFSTEFFMVEWKIIFHNFLEKSGKISIFSKPDEIIPHEIKFLETRIP